MMAEITKHFADINKCIIMKVIICTYEYARCCCYFKLVLFFVLCLTSSKSCRNQQSGRHYHMASHALTVTACFPR